MTRTPEQKMEEFRKQRGYRPNSLTPDHWPYTRRIGCRPGYCFGKPTFMGTRIPPWCMLDYADEEEFFQERGDYLLREDYRNGMAFVGAFQWFAEQPDEDGDDGWWKSGPNWLTVAAAVDDWWEEFAIKKARTATPEDQQSINDEPLGGAMESFYARIGVKGWTPDPE